MTLAIDFFVMSSISRWLQGHIT